MKIDFAKLFRIVTQIVAIVPSLVAAVKPVIDEVKKPKAGAPTTSAQ